MKHFLLCLFLITAVGLSAHSQNIRLNLYGNYAFDDGIDNGYAYNSEGYFEGTLKGGFLWGAGAEFILHDYYGLELMYNRLDTHAPVDFWDYNDIINHNKHADLDVSVNYIMIGGVRYMHPNAKVDPYGGFMLGMAIVDTENPETNYSNNATKFTWGARLGTNIWASDRVGIKLQAQFLSVPQGAGGSLYFGTGGAGAGISTYSSVFQFILGGGLTFKLGGHGKPASSN